jgi:hypothetical protein
MFTFSFLWAAWKAEENVSTEIKTHRLYESPESQCPMEKSKGGGIIHIILQIFFPTCMNVAVSCDIILLTICCCGHFSSLIFHFFVPESVLESSLLHFKSYSNCLAATYKKPFSHFAFL